jgi:hypothetical protein
MVEGKGMKQDICVVPMYNRPEYFTVWTELITKADRSDELLYLFCLDHGYDKRYDELIEKFPFDCAVIRMDASVLQLGKQSRNVLNGMIAAARQADRYVFYIEEDIFIGKDFFRWHYEVQRQQPTIFCSIATRNNNSNFKTDGMREHYYLSNRYDYQALGNCFRKEVITELIAPHFKADYLMHPTQYVVKHFPKSFIGSIWSEQDGLIRRILEQNRMLTAFPHLPRAFHSGFYGYNRYPEITRKSYEYKLQLIREICFDKEKMRKTLEPLGPSYWKDSIPCELDTDFDVLRYKEAKVE